METRTLVISPEEDGRKIRSVLKGVLGFSSRAIASLTRTEQGILLNGQRAFSTAIVHTGDVLCVEIGDRKPLTTPILAGNWPVEIVYEDSYLLVLNKPAGMVSLASSFLPETPTVAGALAYRFGEATPFHVVNRLDKGTTGLMVVARSGYVHNLLRKMLHTSDFQREYRGICVGCPDPKAGIIDLPIGREETSAVARKIRLDGAPSRTQYQVLDEKNGFSLLQLLPETGRTHQLRLHCSAIGHPLVGDWLYGTEVPHLIARPALHSYSLRLLHPVTKQQLSFTANLPQDMQLLFTDFSQSETLPI